MSNKKKPEETIEEAELIQEIPADESVAEEAGASRESDADGQNSPADDQTDVEEAPEELREPLEEFEEHHRSLSSRILSVLAVLVIGGGIALWGGPKLAPYLPAGLAPVANFLAPGQNAADVKIEQLRSDVTAQLDQINTGPDTDLITTMIEEAIAGSLSGQDQEIDALRDQIAASDSAEIESRIATLETRLEGLSSELQVLIDGVHASGETLNAETTDQLSTYAAAISGLKAEIADLASKNGALSQRIDEVAASSARKVEEAETMASTIAMSADLLAQISAVEKALESGSPFDKNLQVIAGLTDQHIPTALSGVATTGVAAMATLKSDFPPAAHAALRASIKESADAGTIGKLSAFLQSQIGTRSLKPKEGSDTDAVLSRIEDLLNKGDLSGALNEAEALSLASAAAMSDWLSAATTLNGAKTALKEFSTALSAVN